VEAGANDTSLVGPLAAAVGCAVELCGILAEHLQADVRCGGSGPNTVRTNRTLAVRLVRVGSTQVNVAEAAGGTPGAVAITVASIFGKVQGLASLVQANVEAAVPQATRIDTTGIVAVEHTGCGQAGTTDRGVEGTLAAGNLAVNDLAVGARVALLHEIGIEDDAVQVGAAAVIGAGRGDGAVPAARSVVAAEDLIVVLRAGNDVAGHVATDKGVQVADAIEHVGGDVIQVHLRIVERVRGIHPAEHVLLCLVLTAGDGRLLWDHTYLDTEEVHVRAAVDGSGCSGHSGLIGRYAIEQHKDDLVAVGASIGTCEHVQGGIQRGGKDGVVARGRGHKCVLVPGDIFPDFVHAAREGTLGGIRRVGHLGSARACEFHETETETRECSLSGAESRTSRHVNQTRIRRPRTNLLQKGNVTVRVAAHAVVETVGHTKNDDKINGSAADLVHEETLADVVLQGASAPHAARVHGALPCVRVIGARLLQAAAVRRDKGRQVRGPLALGLGVTGSSSRVALGAGGGVAEGRGQREVPLAHLSKVASVLIGKGRAEGLGASVADPVASRIGLAVAAGGILANTLAALLCLRAAHHGEALGASVVEVAGSHLRCAVRAESHLADLLRAHPLAVAGSIRNTSCLRGVQAITHTAGRWVLGVVPHAHTVRAVLAVVERQDRARVLVALRGLCAAIIPQADCLRVVQLQHTVSNRGHGCAKV